MRKLNIFLASVAILALGWIGHSLAAEAHLGLNIGEKAPDFMLENYDGTKVSLHDYAGKIVILEWTNPDCPIFQRVYKAKIMQGVYNDYKDRGIVWLGVNSTNYMKNDDNKKWATAQGVSWDILNDAPGTVGHAYGATNTPHMFIIGKDGNLVYKGAIDNDPDGDRKDGKINYVRQALDEVLASKPVSVPETKAYGCSVKYKD